MLLLLQAAHIDVPEVRIAAITAVIDLLMRHGLTAFITSKAGVYMLPNNVRKKLKNNK